MTTIYFQFKFIMKTINPPKASTYTQIKLFLQRKI